MTIYQQRRIKELESALEKARSKIYNFEQSSVGKTYLLYLDEYTKARDAERKLEYKDLSEIIKEREQSEVLRENRILEIDNLKLSIRVLQGRIDKSKERDAELDAEMAALGYRRVL